MTSMKSFSIVIANDKPHVDTNNTTSALLRKVDDETLNELLALVVIIVKKFYNPDYTIINFSFNADDNIKNHYNVYVTVYTDKSVLYHNHFIVTDVSLNDTPLFVKIVYDSFIFPHIIHTTISKSLSVSAMLMPWSLSGNNDAVLRFYKRLRRAISNSFSIEH
ncbi:hypothetical protein [Deltalipothrixvirus pozzuoliense]|uniref:Uncharacterized protein ORF162 n=1 Tax=Acidianus filamentous virus 2 (isolate Italy/Pozzuoli) TaxID=654910 RepID=Y162_AFV2P|nr:hypothetical protein AFV2_gp45 [Acidianus filamentous virus 2]Q573C4.1 RecName: Full=Uncharacterized protein ORF162 [Acidianus filamentous virus 2 (isolate Pozzuoli)]CAH69432.1 hypothetical protein [Acidianus filamentous virus 2]